MASATQDGAPSRVLQKWIPCSPHPDQPGCRRLPTIWSAKVALLWLRGAPLWTKLPCGLNVWKRASISSRPGDGCWPIATAQRRSADCASQMPGLCLKQPDRAPETDQHESAKLTSANGVLARWDIGRWGNYVGGVGDRLCLSRVRRGRRRRRLGSRDAQAPLAGPPVQWRRRDRRRDELPRHTRYREPRADHGVVQTAQAPAVSRG